MEDTGYRAIAIVGAGAVLPDARNVAAFWENVKCGRYSITEVSPDRWNPALYYDPDPAAPDKTYSKIGGWVREFEWDPMKWRMPLPPRVVDAMDGTQKWAIACTREALEDYGYPGRPLNLERTAVILGNAMAGERHYLTTMRVCFPEYARELSEITSFAALPEAVRRDIAGELQERMCKLLPEITEDSMPGELSNCIAGRIANLFNCRGPNYVTDAACASAMAAISCASEGLIARDFDVAITGGTDRNMGASTFVKFCKIGALSATGSRPFAEGADGFVMGEGAAIFVLKRLADAERDGDRIYAVIRGFGGSSDGRGKGITAPNPAGQKFAIERAWQNAGLAPSSATLMEAHGTSTRVGDVVEVGSLNQVLGSFQLPAGSVALGSVKSNIGHLKGAAGAAGLLKTALALRDKVLPPSVQCERPNPDIDFAHSPLYVNTELRPWKLPADGVRRAGLSAFGFGGTNFHAVLEEYIPHRLTGNGRGSVAVSEAPPPGGADVNGSLLAGNGTMRDPLVRPSERSGTAKPPLRGALLIGASSGAGLAARLREIEKTARAGRAPAPAAPAESDLRAAERIAIDYADAADLADKSAKALKALAADQLGTWKALRPQGIFRGCGAAPKVAFLYTGQGSQYPNMLRALRDAEPVVAQTFAESDRVMTPLLGKPLSEYIFVDDGNPDALARAEEDLRQTAITQPAVLAADLALTRLLAAYGIAPDITMGHSLGEYGALVASGALPFEDALEAVSARGREMTSVSLADNGRMAAVFAPLAEIERILQTVNGYVVIANINSNQQAVIGGASEAVGQAIELFQKAGYNAVALPVSHAFHTSIVAPASEPLRRVLERLRLGAPPVPVVANVDGEFYPTGPDALQKMLDILGRQVAAPVQFVKGLQTLYQAGARVFVEVGPKKALHGFAEDVLGGHAEVLALFTNHPKAGDIVSFNQALCGMYAAGLGTGVADAAARSAADTPAAKPDATAVPATDYNALGRLFADMIGHALPLYRGQPPAPPDVSVGITGAALGLPGKERIFDDANIGRILRGEQFIDVIPTRYRRAMLDKNITRLVKREDGGPVFEHIQSPADVIKLAGRGGAFDLEKEFGVSAERMSALDRDTQLAIAVGIDALRDAGIPLVMRYKTTTKGTQLPDRWELPHSMRDDTGVIFASAFPGCDSFADEMARYYADRGRRDQLAALLELRARETGSNGRPVLVQELDRRIEELRAAIEKDPYVFDRRFIFKLLPMGHSQFAEYIGARGPNTQVNAACASTTHAISVAQDWIRAGRCRRVVIISADDITSDHLIEWLGAAFLASGVAATDEIVEEAAIPFDRRRHGMIMGMGAASLVLESADAARERGIQPICDVVSAVTANSAFHGTRLDPDHIGQVMERLVAEAEQRIGIPRAEFAQRMAFVSHETYTPARGGSASAEIHSLRRVFGDVADRIVITNTKGFTGHAMATGIEDVVAVKALETGCVPPVANFKEVDPELGPLNLSKGGMYPIEFALRFGAGFGSQISMALLRWVGTRNGLRPSPHALGYTNRIVDPAAWNAWLSRMAGHPTADLEVVNRTLRVRDRGAVAVAPPLPEPVVAAEAAPPIPAPNPPVPSATPAKDPVAERVHALVAEKTGYPVDMLDPDLDLEADLGVDTVKQAEVFAAIRQEYGIPRDPNLKLRDFPTLAHVVRFVHDRTGERPVATASPTPAAPPPMPAATVPAAPPPMPVATVPAADPIREKVLAIVAGKTGYPQDMLDPDLDLEADLGIDTVKQAEMFAAIREAYNIPRDANLKLRDFPTLAHVIRFAQERAGAAAPVAPIALARRPVPAGFDATAQVPRRVPVPVLRPPLTLCKQTGVALGAGVRVAIMADAGHAGEALAARLAELGVEVVPIEDALDGAPVNGVYWLPALDPEGDLQKMEPAAWHDAVKVRVKQLYSTMRKQYGAFLISATRLGGLHGYDEAGALAPLGGAVSGFTKAYKRERMDALVKAIDFEAACRPADVAELLVEETLRDTGAVEIGYRGGLRFTIGLEERPAADGRPGLALDKDTVFVVTGAAGSIVAAITADLAAASGGTFYLLDLTPEPDPRNPDLGRFTTDKDGLKRDLFARIQARGERATPALVEKELAALERALAARDAIDAVRAAGGTAHYFSVNLTDADAVSRVIDEVRQRSGRIDVLLHAAGLDRSHSLADKEPPEFDLVFDVKAEGWFNLMRAIGDMPLKATVAFSSIAGRFGNAGQTDYSAANDLLCKIASSFRTTRPETRAIAIDWTAWGGIGMASRGSIPKIMELAGIAMLPAEAGIPWIRRELTEGGARGEIVVAQDLGMLLNEWDAAGGLDSRIPAYRTGPIAGSAVTMGVQHGLTIETTLDPAAQPFLHDHQIEDTPVLPGVMGIEAFAEAALWPLPGWHIDAIEDVNFLYPFKFYRNEPRTLTVNSTFHPEGDRVVAKCRLTGTRTLANQAEPQLTTHFTAAVRLAKGPLGDSSGPALSAPSGSLIESSAIYSMYFHGPAYQVVERAWWNEQRIVGQMPVRLPANHVPDDLPLAIAPRLIELCFQTAGLWEMALHHRMGLPHHIDQVRLYRNPEYVDGPLFAVVTAGAGRETFDAEVTDSAGNRYLHLRGYRTVTFRENVDFEALRGIQTVMA
ncbi:MAG TPA: SDR family NAD(P)-dependent oxidoreductase [Candidatus Acidoferrales bacterium]|nr:SDR family NAD(P)-dependent oxidoreductase [Candidatus Acidoferrales bacterium]